MSQETNMNHTWSEDALKVLDKLKNDKRLKQIPKNRDMDTKNFIRCKSEFPKFDYELFIDDDSQKISGVCYFGTHIEGPPGCVHGGAIATILDAMFGTMLWQLKISPCVTGNLNVNYRKFLPLNGETQLFGEVEKIEGRKIFVKGKITSLDETILHDDGSALFIKIDKF